MFSVTPGTHLPPGKDSVESRDGSFRPVMWARSRVPASGGDEKPGEPFPPSLGWREPPHLLGLPSHPRSFCDVALGLGDVSGCGLKTTDCCFA